MKKKFSETGPLPPFKSVAVIDQQLNVISDSTLDAMDRHFDIGEELDTARASLAEVESAQTGDVDELTGRGVELKTRIDVLTSQLEAARLAVVESLKADELALSDKIAAQRAYHVEVRTAARAMVEKWAREKFEKRAAALIAMNHTKDTLVDKNSRIILDTLAARHDEIRQRLAEYETPTEGRTPHGNVFT